MTTPNIKILGYKIEARFICPINDPDREPETDYHYFDGKSHSAWSTVAPGITNTHPPKLFDTVEAAAEKVKFWVNLAQLTETENGLTLPHKFIHEAFYSEEEQGEDFRLEFDVVPVIEVIPVSTVAVTFSHAS